MGFVKCGGRWVNPKCVEDLHTIGCDTEIGLISGRVIRVPGEAEEIARWLTGDVPRNTVTPVLPQPDPDLDSMLLERQDEGGSRQCKRT